MATPQQQESNGRPSSSSPSPPRHFFRVMLPNTVHAQKLILPEGFVQEFGDDLCSLAKLTDPNERVWQVGVEKSVNDVWFGDKWKDFVEYYSVTYGYFIVFKYEGNSSFRVIIFDPSTCEITYPSTTHQQPLLSFHQHEIGTGEISDAPTSDQQPNHALPHGEEIATKEGVQILGSNSNPLASDQQPNHAQPSLPHHEPEIGTLCDTPTSDQQPNNTGLSLLPHHGQELGTKQGVKNLGSDHEIIDQCDAPTSEQQPNCAQLSLPHNGQGIGTGGVVGILGSDREISYPCDSLTSDLRPSHAELSLPHHDQEIGTEEVENLDPSSRHASHASLENISCEKPSLAMVRILSHDEQQESLLDEARYSKNGENVETRHLDSAGMDIDDDQVNESASCKSADKIGSHSSHKTNKRTKTRNHEEDTGTSRKKGRKAKSPPLVRRAATEQEVADALHRSRLFRSDNPFFTIVMGKSNLKNPHVYVPKPFCEEYMKGPPGWLKLEVSDGRQWPVSYSYSNGQGSAKCLRKGWAAFHKENFLDLGDACVFELVKKDDIVFRVEIFRARQESSGVLTLTFN